MGTHFLRRADPGRSAACPMQSNAALCWITLRLSVKVACRSLPNIKSVRTRTTASSSPHHSEKSSALHMRSTRSVRAIAIFRRNQGCACLMAALGALALANQEASLVTKRGLGASLSAGVTIRASSLKPQSQVTDMRPWTLGVLAAAYGVSASSGPMDWARKTLGRMVRRRTRRAVHPIRVVPFVQSASGPLCRTRDKHGRRRAMIHALLQRNAAPRSPCAMFGRHNRPHIATCLTQLTLRFKLILFARTTKNSVQETESAGLKITEALA